MKAVDTVVCIRCYMRILAYINPQPILFRVYASATLAVLACFASLPLKAGLEPHLGITKGAVRYMVGRDANGRTRVEIRVAQ